MLYKDDLTGWRRDHRLKLKKKIYVVWDDQQDEEGITA